MVQVGKIPQGDTRLYIDSTHVSHIILRHMENYCRLQGDVAHEVKAEAVHMIPHISLRLDLCLAAKILGCPVQNAIADQAGHHMPLRGSVVHALKADPYYVTMLSDCFSFTA